MAKYLIKYGVGGGINSITEEEFEYNTLEQAEEDAYEMACESYESYAGNNGLPNWSDIEKDPEYYGIDDFNNMTKEEQEECIEEAFVDARESWLVYSAKLIE